MWCLWTKIQCWAIWGPPQQPYPINWSQDAWLWSHNAHKCPWRLSSTSQVYHTMLWGTLRGEVAKAVPDHLQTWGRYYTSKSLQPMFVRINFFKSLYYWAGLTDHNVILPWWVVSTVCMLVTRTPCQNHKNSIELSIFCRHFFFL